MSCPSRWYTHLPAVAAPTSTGGRSRQVTYEAHIRHSLAQHHRRGTHPHSPAQHERVAAFEETTAAARPCGFRTRTGLTGAPVVAHRPAEWRGHPYLPVRRLLVDDIRSQVAQPQCQHTLLQGRSGVCAKTAAYCGIQPELRNRTAAWHTNRRLDVLPAALGASAHSHCTLHLHPQCQALLESTAERREGLRPDS